MDRGSRAFLPPTVPLAFGGEALSALQKLMRRIFHPQIIHRFITTFFARRDSRAAFDMASMGGFLGIAMRQLTSIVALNQTGAIGAGNALPWRVRSDLRFFKENTLNNVVIMGRKTFDSLGRRGLPNRKNIVVTRGFKMISQASDCHVAGSISEALLMADSIKTKKQEVFVVGGASMYEQFSPFVDRYLITEIQKDVPDADTFFDSKLVGEVDNWTVKVLQRGQADGLHDEANFVMYEFKSTSPATFLEHREIAVSALKCGRDGNSLHADFRALQAYG